jgi:hypothetical protein
MIQFRQKCSLLCLKSEFNILAFKQNNGIETIMYTVYGIEKKPESQAVRSGTWAQGSRRN